MKIKVNHSELYDVTRVINKDADDYNKEIDNMLAQIEKLRSIWQGGDSKIFCDKAHDYINNMKKITHTMSTISKLSDQANKGYTEVDESFGKELEVEANNYE